jgi:short-subunit dehydrogenase
MLKRPTRSAIINVSSIAGTIPFPGNTTYAATKVFIDYFSRALAFEVRAKVDVLSLRPAFVATNMTKMKAKGFCITPLECVNASFRDLGHTYATFGAVKHDI